MESKSVIKKQWNKIFGLYCGEYVIIDRIDLQSTLNQYKHYALTRFLYLKFIKYLQFKFRCNY